ncbi:MAG: hypothetical protein ACP5Q1_03015 [Anaerolineae bacterium]
MRQIQSHEEQKMTAPMYLCTHAPLLHPSLEYQYAFDLCAVEAQHTGGQVALFASSPFYARELLKRLAGCEITLVAIGEWSRWAHDLQAWLGAEIAPSAFSLAPPYHRTRVHCAVWAEPERTSGAQALRDMGEMLLPGGKLCVIASGWLARFLPEWQRNKSRPSTHPAGLRQAIAWLRHSGFAVKACDGFHGPQSILWGYASRWMERLGRGDSADRCLFQMRATYAVRGWQALLAPVGLTCARRQ